MVALCRVVVTGKEAELAKQASMELARKASENHGDTIDLMHVALSRFASDLEGGERVGVTVSVDTDPRSDHAVKAAHVVALTHFAADGSVISHPQKVMITTEHRIEPKGQGIAVSFVTRARAILGGVLVDVLHDKTVGEIIQ